jgi:hypothetical protein
MSASRRPTQALKSLLVVHTALMMARQAQQVDAGVQRFAGLLPAMTTAEALRGCILLVGRFHRLLGSAPDLRCTDTASAAASGGRSPTTPRRNLTGATGQLFFG